MRKLLIIPRFRRATPVLLCGLLVAHLALVSGPASGRISPAVPLSVFSSLQRMNTELSRLIAAEGQHQITAARLRFRVRAVVRRKLRMIRHDFPRVLGMSYTRIFLPLECIDLELADADALSITRGGLARRDQDALAQRITADVDNAQSCHETLADTLEGRAGTAASLPGDLAALSAALESLQSTLSQRTLTEPQIAPLITNIEKQKLTVAGDLPPVFGLPYATVFSGLDCVDVRLTQVRTLASEIAQGHSTGMRDLGRWLRQAKRCKDTLEKTLAHAPAPTPSASEPISWGSDLAAQPIPALGEFNADVEYWFGALRNPTMPTAAGYSPSTTAPLQGIVTKITVKGYAIKGDRPGPDASEPIRFSVARPQPDGQLQVITTTDPPFTLPGSPGTYTFDMSQVRFRCCKVMRGDVISLDARGGEFAVFGSAPGSVTDVFSSSGLTQNEGFMWTGTPRGDVELLMQVTEQPSK